MMGKRERTIYNENGVREDITVIESLNEDFSAISI